MKHHFFNFFEKLLWKQGCFLQCFNKSNYRTQLLNTAKKLRVMSRSYNFIMKNCERISTKTGVPTIY